MPHPSRPLHRLHPSLQELKRLCAEAKASDLRVQGQLIKPRAFVYIFGPASKARANFCSKLAEAYRGVLLSPKVLSLIRTLARTLIPNPRPRPYPYP